MKRFFVLIAVVSFVAGVHSAPAPVVLVPPGGVIVLDDCDETYTGKAKYEDNLTFLDNAGKLRTRINGLNMCQEIGSTHRIAVDPERKNVWVAETVGRRLVRYDFEGKELSATADVQSSAVAVDPDSGNAWVASATELKVYSSKGDLLASHSVPGYDIAYDGKSKAFWVVGKELIKVSLAGSSYRDNKYRPGMR